MEGNARTVLASMTIADVPALYWTAVAWGGALTLADSPLVRIAEVATVRALFARALELDEAWEAGAIHEAMIAVESLPLSARRLAGSREGAFRSRGGAVDGQSAFAYVTMATGVAQPAKDRREFERLLRAAIAIDPRSGPRCASRISSRRSAPGFCSRRSIDCSNRKTAGSRRRVTWRSYSRRSAAPLRSRAAD